LATAAWNASCSAFGSKTPDVVASAAPAPAATTRAAIPAMSVRFVANLLKFIVILSSFTVAIQAAVPESFLNVA
jgi:hypothetical protein